MLGIVYRVIVTHLVRSKPYSSSSQGCAATLIKRFYGVLKAIACVQNPVVIKKMLDCPKNKKQNLRVLPVVRKPSAA